MNEQKTPVTLAINDPVAKAEISELILSLEGLRVSGLTPGDPGILICEPGPDPDADLAGIRKALASGAIREAFIASSEASPEMLIRAMRLGVKEFVRLPVDRAELAEALGRGRGRLRRGPDQGRADRGRIIAVAGAKPGIGATTLAVNLAHGLERLGAGPTAILDLRRPAGDVPMFLDLDYSFTWAELMEDVSRLDPTYLRSLMVGHDSGLQVLPGPNEDRSAPDMDPEALELLLAEMCGCFCSVVLDAGPDMDDAALARLAMADEVVLALALSLPCLSRAKRFLQSLAGLGPDAETKVRLAVCRQRKDSDIDIREAEEVLGRRTTWVVPDDYKNTLSAMNQGKPLAEVAAKSPAARAFQGMARDLAPSGRARPRASIFRFLGLGPKTSGRRAEAT
ncbi:MAG: histidine kinase [Desulfovibrionaceae bacterium]|nr:histidine kinase [Desulfovibrionaceae bacterium]